MIEILYADSQVVAAVKPSGVLSQDAGEHSMPGLLREQLQREQIYVIHRLDRDAGGVMIFALTSKAAAELSRAVRSRALEKHYLAVLRGIPGEERAMLEDLLFHDRHRNKTYVVDRQRKGVKDAKLEYTLLETVEERSLVHIRLHTGRTHQIRVQFASRQLPLAGDGTYGGKEPGSTLGLWCQSLTFPHPITGEPVTVSQTPPETAPWNKFSIKELCK